MREISFVKRLKFNFNGSITKKALVIGDADNDQSNELVCANLQGDLAIFKETNSDSYAHASDLGMVTACVVGDVINSGKNYVVAINTEGWLYIFDVPCKPQVEPSNEPKRKESPVALNLGATLDPIATGQSATPKAGTTKQQGAGLKLTALYDQRMPSNCKELLLADLDGDGQNEVIVGLTDRVLRTYKWIKIGPDRGKFVGLYKWEFADQIGAVSLNPSQHENCQDIIVAQPGGTYAKLECFDKKPPSAANMLVSSTTPSSGNPDTASDRQSTQNNQHQTKNYDQEQLVAAQTFTPAAPSIPSAAAAAAASSVIAGATVSAKSAPISPSTNDGDNVRTEYISKLTPEYHQLALGQMRNHHISTEVLGGIRDGKNSDSRSLIVIATLDGTLMLVNKDDILWSLQVAHQLFALAVIETPTPGIGQAQTILTQSESTCTIVPNHEVLNNRSRLSSGDSGSNESGQQQTNQVHHQSTLLSTGATLIGETQTPTKTTKSPQTNFTQHFVVCAWNGKTYIIDEERNYLRFKFDEAVSAFTAGNYHFDGKAHASLVYATFNNQIILYYDVILDHIRPMYLLDELIANSDYNDLLLKLETVAKRLGLCDEFGAASASESVAEQPLNESNNTDQAAADASPTLGDGRRSKRIHELLQDILYNLTDEELYGYLNSA